MQNDNKVMWLAENPRIVQLYLCSVFMLVMDKIEQKFDFGFYD